MLNEKRVLLPLLFIAFIVVVGSFSYNFYWIIFNDGSCETKTRFANDLGGEIHLLDQNNKRVKLSTQQADISLIYFGYSFCPDICPYDLERNAYAKDIMDKLGKKINLVFVTLDPKRDTSERLKEFSEYIHEDLISLTGSEEEIEKIKDLYKVYGKSNKKDLADNTYLVDHSTYTYLTDRNGKVLTFFNRRATPETISEKMLCFL